jgi:hypothetical protein
MTDGWGAFESWAERSSFPFRQQLASSRAAAKRFAFFGRRRPRLRAARPDFSLDALIERIVAGGYGGGGRAGARANVPPLLCAR